MQLSNLIAAGVPNQPKPAVLLLSLLSTLAFTTTAADDNNDSDIPYSDQVCKPAVASPGNPVPPCISIEYIQGACTPNGTSPLALDAHAQCMCAGSFFREWSACRQCLFFHGQVSERDLGYWQSAIGLASSSLCGAGAAPTAAFDVIFTEAQARATPPATGPTSSSDQAPSETAVSLYYTPSGAVGPGSITGSAASATKTGSSGGDGDDQSGSATATDESSSKTTAQTTKATSGGSQTTAAGSSETSNKPSGGATVVSSPRLALLGAVVGAVLTLL